MTSLPGQQTITIYSLPNILRSKGNQTMKFGQLIRIQEEKYFSSKIMQKITQGDQFQNSFSLQKSFVCKSKCSVAQFQYSPQLGIQQQNSNKLDKLQAIDPEICSVFEKRVWEQFLHHISWIIFSRKMLLRLYSVLYSNFIT